MKKPYQNSLLRKACIVGLLSIFTTVTVFADENILEKNINNNELSWISSVEEGNFMLRVTGPDGFIFEKVFKGVPPAMSSFGPDGQYRYEITVLPVLTNAEKMTMRMARETNNPSAMRTLKKKSQKQSGYFRVQGGVILNSNEKEIKDTK